MPTLKIDNREITVPDGTKVIEAAERVGIVIPRFCYHPALGSVGACRVCAVAFKEGPVKGIQMSCMVDAQDGMVVSTTDPEAVDFRKHVIEFLMLNHPHDCPVCDEGGHCLLQDLTVAGGHGMRRYQGLKRTHRNQDLGPLVQHEMNRCIQCYRCMRYYQEYAGGRDLGVMGIGSRVYFGRVSAGTLESPFAGNLIDVCPTGVYTDKPSRFFGRRWDFERQPSVCLHCSLGCNLTVSARYRQVVRHEARANPDVNGHFICDRGRYGYAYANLANRPRQALVEGMVTDLDAVLDRASAAIHETVRRSGPQSVAVAASTRCSLETLAVIGQACRRNGWSAPAVVVTDRLAGNLQTAVARLTPDLAISQADIASANEVLVIGADPLGEGPMLALALRQAVRNGGRVTVIDPRGIALPLEFDHWPVHPSDLGRTLDALNRQIQSSDAPADEAAAPFPITELARRLNGSPRPVIVCGTDILTPDDVARAADIAGSLQATHKTVGLSYLLPGPNAVATALGDGPVVSAEGLVAGIEAGTIRTLVAVETDLWQTFPNRQRLVAALKRLDHLVVLDYLATQAVEEAAVFIPTMPVYECGGLWINQEGRLQAATPVLAGGEPIGLTGSGDHPPRIFESRIPGGTPLPAWRAVTRLAATDESVEAEDGFLDTALDRLPSAITRPLAEALGQRIHFENHAAAAVAPVNQGTVGDGILLLMVDRTFGTEPLSALSPVLAEGDTDPVGRMHPDTMAALKLTDGGSVTITIEDGRLILNVTADAGMATGVLVVPRHHHLDWQVAGDTRLTVAASEIEAT